MVASDVTVVAFATTESPAVDILTTVQVEYTSEEGYKEEKNLNFDVLGARLSRSCINAIKTPAVAMRCC
jgi:hypothetical protein